MTEMLLISAATTLNWADFGLNPVIAEIGPFSFRWYSMAYLVGIVFGWWYLAKLVSRPGAPMSATQVDDFIVYVTLGIILGGRIGHVVFYQPELFLEPLKVLKIWEGGMSFHGGVLGVMLAILILVWRSGLSWLRVLDYVAVVYPVGHLLGRLANFVNGELWGRASDLPWAMTFPGAGDAIARHPSQLYQAGLEGLALALILCWMFYRTDARLMPGRLAGAFGIIMGTFRFLIEFVREPEGGTFDLLGLTSGQALSVPLILIGAWLFFRAPRHRIAV